MKLKFIPKPPKSELPFAIGIPALVWQMLFFYVPLMLLLVSSFVKFSDTDVFQGITFEHVGQFLTPTYLKVILSSLLLGQNLYFAKFQAEYWSAPQTWQQTKNGGIHKFLLGSQSAQSLHGDS